MRDSSKTRAQQATTRTIATLLERSSAVVLYGDYESAQSFLDRYVRSRWFAKCFPGVADLGVVLKPLGTNTNASRSSWSWEAIALKRIRFKASLFPVMLMPIWALDELTILHVLAHVCVGKEHSRDWARTFLNLTARCLGKKRAEVLRESFRLERVRWHRRPVLTEEAREKLRDRMKKMHDSRRALTDYETGAGGA